MSVLSLSNLTYSRICFQFYILCIQIFFFFSYVKIFGLKQENGQTKVDTAHPSNGTEFHPLPFNIPLRNFALLSTGVGNEN